MVAACGSLCLSAQEGRDLELIVVVRIGRVMHSRHRAPVLVEALWSPTPCILRYRLLPSFCRARRDRPRDRPLGQRRHLRAHWRPLGRRRLGLLAPPKAHGGEARKQ